LARKLKDRIGDATKPEQITALSRATIRQLAAMHKLLPHELLLYWANGITVAGFTPNQSQQLAAAMAAAPYYAPKLANIEVKQDVRMRAVISAEPMDQATWENKYLHGNNNQSGGGVVEQLSKTIPLTDNTTGETATSTRDQLPNPNDINKTDLTFVDSKTATIEIFSNRNSLESHRDISPSTANPNLDCSTDHNTVYDDDDDDTL